MIVFAADQIAALAAAAETAWPEEACAMLEGTASAGQTRVARVHFADNVAADRTRGFEVDPSALFRLHRAVRGGPTALVGVWHSHPGGGARPSATDRGRAWEPELVWVITPVADGRAGTAAAWRLDGAGEGAAFAPESLEVTG